MPNAVIEAKKPLDRKGFFFNDKGVLLKPLSVDGQHIFFRISTSRNRIIIKLEKSTHPKITNTIKLSMLDFARWVAKQTDGTIIHHNLKPSGKFDSSLYGIYEITLNQINSVDWINTLLNKETISLEIGMGSGEFLTDLALKHQDEGFVGVEILNSDFHVALRRFSRHGLSNVKAIHYDAKAVLSRFKPNSLKAVYLNFPEPWFKLKRLKRSILTPKVAKEIETILKVGGSFNIVTDNYPFAVSAAVILESATDLKSSTRRCIEPNYQPIRTKYEKKWIRYERKIWRLSYVKQQISKPFDVARIEFPIELPEQNLITNEYVFKLLNIYRSETKDSIAEIAVGYSKNPQHIFFGLEENRWLYPIKQTQMVINHDLIEALRLAHR